MKKDRRSSLSHTPFTNSISFSLSLSLCLSLSPSLFHGAGCLVILHFPIENVFSTEFDLYTMSRPMGAKGRVCGAPVTYEASQSLFFSPSFYHVTEKAREWGAP